MREQLSIKKVKLETNFWIHSHIRHNDHNLCYPPPELPASAADDGRDELVDDTSGFGGSGCLPIEFGGT